MVEVAVRLGPQRRDIFTVVGARQALVMADYVLDRDVEAAAQPAHQLETGSQLVAVAEDLSIAEADMLDSDRGPVQPHRVPAHGPERDQLVDRPRLIDHEVRAG